jgi:MoaA/NifB/PqqE/SkfB family radical SAM enzyme
MYYIIKITLSQQFYRKFLSLLHNNKYSTRKNMDFTPGKPIRTYSENGSWRDWSTDELVGAKLNYVPNWKCGAGVDSLYVDMDGYVWTASCRVGGKLGNVFDDFRVPEDWIDCKRNNCSCGADLFIPKVSKIEFKNLLRRSHDLETEVDKYNDTLTNFVAMERTHASNQKQVYWEIGRRCNYDCSYCWSWIHNNTDRHKTLEELMGATSLIEEKFTKGQAVNFIISGGEPTVNKDFLDWLRYLNVMGHHVSLHSNGSRLPDYYREVIHYGDLNLSVHFEFYDREKFVKVVAAIVDEKANNGGSGHLEIKFMMAPHNREETLILEQELKELPYFTEYCTWAVVPIRGGLDNNKSTPDKSSGSEIMEGYTKEDYVLFGDRK